MTTPIANIDNATLLNLTPNLDVGDIADPALRLAYFQYLNVYIQTITTAFNAFVANGAISTVNLALLAVTTANLAAGIDTVKLADGSVTNTEFQFINSLTSNAQAQLDAKIPLAQKGIAGGVSTLDTGAKVPISQLPDAIVGALQYQGTWNASTNTPTLSASPTTIKGYFYIVSVAGTQFSISFDVGDWIVSNGTIWQKVDNTDAVSSFNGRLGAILPAQDDYSFAQINKSTSSLADLTTRNAGDLNIGTLPVGRVPTGIPATSIGNGDVSNAILSFLNTLSSNAQTQLNAKAPLTHVGSNGIAQHAIADSTNAGFLSSALSDKLIGLQATGLVGFAVPVGQVFSLWSRYSQEQDPVTGELVFYEI